ncbi:ABC transporter permease [Couchioplanes azureus]|uniref:ABC transporter permease n=1 Tax=Couchioplanes caeruleus TaxID=56438 RepID=UPI0016708E16|nr:ABC transporter permease [Couchioplanes caeruleus]GGQ68452.1 exporter of polyketide antibiotics [Couchioplanes caeruleus subsp. azureus]
MTGTGRLVRLILRRDRVLLPLWVVVLALVPAGYVGSFRELFPTEAERLQYATVSAGNAGFVALYGPLHGSSLGELVAWRGGFLPVMIALFSLLTVVRHTRADEEAGRTELIGAGVVGRRAGLAAALTVTLGATVVLALILAPAMISQGLPVAGSVLLAAEYALAGWVFAAAGAVAAQLAAGARTARAIAVVALGAAYALRLAGDVSGAGGGPVSWLAWLSPIGWVQRMFPYGENRWWPGALVLVLTAGLVATAAVLAARRDVGAGLVAPRPGPAAAAPGLRTPVALAWRLHRGPLAGWIAGFAALGLVFGGVVRSVADLTSGNPALARIFARMGGSSGATDSFLAGTTGLMGVIAAACAVQATLRLRDEETAGHAELVLATGSGRLRWIGSHLLFALAGPALALAVGGAVCGLVAGLTLHDSGQFTRVLGGMLAQLPAVAVLGALTVLLFGVVPRAAPAAWAAVAGCVLLLMTGATLGLSQWVMDLSPFTHVPHLPGGEPSATPFVILTAVAVVFAGAGLAGARRRDIPAT